jgi:general secretion pathway protein H
MIRGSQRGFTLLELLLVLAVIGLAIGIVRFSLPGDEQLYSLEKGSHQLFGRMELANEEAVLRNRILGLRFYTIDSYGELRTAYQWLIHREQSWDVLADDKVFADNRLPNKLLLQAEREGEPILVEKPLEEEILTPDLVFAGTGEGVPFFIKLSMLDRDEVGFTIRGDYQGRIMLLGKDHDED